MPQLDHCESAIQTPRDNGPQTSAPTLLTVVESCWAFCKGNFTLKAMRYIKHLLFSPQCCLAVTSLREMLTTSPVPRPARCRRLVPGTNASLGLMTHIANPSEEGTEPKTSLQTLWCLPKKQWRWFIKVSSMAWQAEILLAIYFKVCHGCCPIRFHRTFTCTSLVLG